MAAQLRTYFAECGMQDTGAIAGRQTTEFIQSQGFTSIDDFNGLKQADIGRLVKSFNASAPATGAIGFMVQKKLEALAFWVTEHKKRQLPLDAANWNAAAIEEARKQADIAHERRLNPQVPKRVEKIQTGIDWYTWNEKFENYLSSIRGVEDVPLTYVIRRDKPPGWNPETDSSNEEEKLIYQVALFGAAFEDDNKVVFSKLMEVTLGEPSYEWIRRFEATKDGRQAMITLRSHCEGDDYVELRITEADRIIRDAHYNNERAYPFESYVTQLQKAYTIYEQTNQPWPDRQKVKRMVDKINIVGHFLISHAKAHVKDVLHDDWIAAVSYMKTKVAEAFPGVTGISPKDRSGRRFIRETNSGGRFGGRGRGGRFGRGRGRGGGDYQGRGGRGGQGGYASKAELLSDGRIPKEVNGVNTANIFRSFSPEEWRALGQEWQSKIRNRRESAPERGTGGRNISEARISETQGDGNAKLNETADNGKGNEGPKGGKAGLGFGRGGGRRIKAIVSGPRSFDRQVKRTTTSQPTNLKYNHVVNATAKCELDTRADTICAGKNFRALELTGQTCEVSGFHQSFDSLKNVPIAKAATAYTLETGETVILVFNEVLFFGNQMDHSLINPNQIRAYGIDVSDNPFDKDKDFGIDHAECFVPFQTAGSTIFFESFVPSDEQLNSLRCIELSDPEEWDPSGVQLNYYELDSREKFIRQATRSDTRHSHETDDVLASISEALCPSLFVKRLIESVHVVSKQEFDMREERYVKEVKSNERHSKITPERVSRVFGIGLNAAKTTLAVTTQRGVRHAVHPLNRRYRVDHLDLHRHRLKGQWYLDHLTARKRSLNQNTGAWVFTNGNFSKVYPVRSRPEVVNALDSLCDDIGIPERLKMDRAPELVGKGTDFYKLARKRHIRLDYAEPDRHNQIAPVDVEMRELEKRTRAKMVRRNVPSRMWDYALVHAAEVMQFIPRPGLRGRTGHEEVTGKTPDISEYLDFDFWDLVWYWDGPHPGISTDDRRLARWCGVAHRVGSDMCYWLALANGSIIAETTVQHVTRDEMNDPDIAQRIEIFNRHMTERLDDTNFTNPAAEGFPQSDDVILLDERIRDQWQMDPAYGDGTNTPSDSDYGEPPDRPEEDDIDLDTYDKLIGAQVLLDDGMKATVKRRLTNFDGTPIGQAHSNPLLDTRQYEVELEDGTTDAYFANVIAENLYSQVDSEGRELLAFKEICDHRKNARAISIQDGYDISRNGNRTPKRTTVGWELLVEWRDGSTDWVPLKDLKDTNPVELAEYAVANKIAEEPAFKWWVDFCLRKRNRMINKVKAKYWRTTHKYGIKLPKTAEEALQLDKMNGNDYWEQAIKKEMSKVRVAYEPNEKYTPEDVRSGKAPEMTGFQEITCHLIFDVKMDFTRKARFVANGSKTEAPLSITYSSVVSRDSVRLAFLIAALNDLDIMSCDIGNAYLNAPCREKIWFKAGIECGEHKGKVMIVTRALYGLKSSGAAWRSMFAESLRKMGWIPTRVDSDVYRRRAVKPSGENYWELLLVYVDDCLVVSHDPKSTMMKIGEIYELKDGKYGAPESYLGAGIEKFTLPDGTEAWSMKSDKYCKAAVETVKTMLAEEGKELKSGKRSHKGPLPPGYKPELDITKELDAEMVQRYQQLIGILRWAVELGRVDIAVEVAILSQYQANPREGHLEALYLIFHFLSKNPLRRLVFDARVPACDEDAFQLDADWTEFYGDVEEEDPPDMPEPLGKPVHINVFVDADHAGNVVTRRSHSGIFIFVNNAMIKMFTKKQNTVESSTYGSEMVSMRISRDYIVEMRIKLKMFGCPIAGPANVYCDNKGVVSNTSIPESTLSKKHNSINYHVIREAVAAKIMRVAKENTQTNLADALTKLLPYSRKQELMMGVLWDR